MKLRHLLPLCSCALTLTAQPAADAARKPGGATAEFTARTFKSDSGSAIDHSLFVPPDIRPGEKLPLVLCLHGAGGNTEAAKVLVTAERQAKQRCIIMAPACDPRTARWVAMPFRATTQRSVTPELLDALDAIAREFPVELNRVYVTGQSMGGVGTWGLIAAEPQRFAAAVPICGNWQPSDAAKMTRVPIWTFHGDKDPTVPVDGTRQMVAALRAAGGAPRYTEYAGVGHNSWSQAYATEELWTWLFAQRRSQKP